MSKSNEKEKKEEDKRREEERRQQFNNLKPSPDSTVHLFLLSGTLLPTKRSGVYD